MLVCVVRVEGKSETYLLSRSRKLPFQALVLVEQLLVFFLQCLESSSQLSYQGAGIDVIHGCSVFLGYGQRSVYDLCGWAFTSGRRQCVYRRRSAAQRVGSATALIVMQHCT